MGRGAQRIGGRETAMRTERIGIARILPRPPGPFQVSAFHRVRRGFAENRNRKNPEEEFAQEILDGAKQCFTRICAAQVNRRTSTGTAWLSLRPSRILCAL